MSFKAWICSTHPMYKTATDLPSEHLCGFSGCVCVGLLGAAGISLVESKTSGIPIAINNNNNNKIFLHKGPYIFRQSKKGPCILRFY